MNRKAWLSIGILSTALVGLLAFVTWHCMAWMVDRRVATQGNLWSSERWPQKLGLTDEQRARIKPLETDLKAKLDKAQIQLASKNIAVCRLIMSSDKIDQKSLGAALDETAAIEREKEQWMMDHLVALRDVLTPDQQKTLFTTIMRDICRSCQKATGDGHDMCGMCAIPKGKSQ